MISSLDELLHGQDDLRLTDTLTDTGSNLGEEYVQIEGSRILGGILQKLPSTLRAVISLCYMEGLRIKEAAERLRASVSAMKTWHLRANRLILNVVRGRRTRREIEAIQCEAASTNLVASFGPEQTNTKNDHRRGSLRRKGYLVRASLRRMSSSKPTYKTKPVRRKLWSRKCRYIYWWPFVITVVE